MALTIKQMNIIEDELANNQTADDLELETLFVEYGIDRLLARQIIRRERDNYLTDPFYEINWAVCHF